MSSLRGSTPLLAIDVRASQSSLVEVRPPTRVEVALKFLFAWLIAFIWLFSMRYARLVQADVPPQSRWTVAITLAVNVAAAIVFIRMFRGPNRDWTDPLPNPLQLSAWGYGWRAMVANIAAVLVILAFEFALSLDHRLAAFNPSMVLMWEVFSILAIAIACWLLYSRDYKGQLRKVASAIRGF